MPVSIFFPQTVTTTQPGAALTAAEIKQRYESLPNTNPYTDTEKQKLAALDDPKWLGTFTNLAALTNTYPTPEAGQFAHVDAGAGSPVAVYIWDSTDNNYVLQQGETTAETAESVRAKYLSNADTNNYDDAAKAKLDALKAGDFQLQFSLIVSKDKGGYQIDGTADDVEIQQALDDAYTTGMNHVTVDLRHGDAIITQTLKHWSNVKLVVIGKGKLKANSPLGAIIESYNSPSDETGAGQGQHFVGEIDCNNQSGGIKIDGTNRYRVNAEIRNVGANRTGIHGESVSGRGPTIQPIFEYVHVENGHETSTAFLLGPGCSDAVSFGMIDLGVCGTNLQISSGDHTGHNLGQIQTWGAHTYNTNLYQANGCRIASLLCDRGFRQGLHINDCQRLKIGHLAVTDNNYQDPTNEYGRETTWNDTANTHPGLTVINSDVVITTIEEGNTNNNPDQNGTQIARSVDGASTLKVLEELEVTAVAAELTTITDALTTGDLELAQGNVYYLTGTATTNRAFTLDLTPEEDQVVIADFSQADLAGNVYSFTVGATTSSYYSATRLAWKYKDGEWRATNPETVVVGNTTPGAGSDYTPPEPVEITITETSGTRAITEAEGSIYVDFTKLTGDLVVTLPATPAKNTEYTFNFLEDDLLSGFTLTINGQDFTSEDIVQLKYYNSYKRTQ